MTWGTEMEFIFVIAPLPLRHSVNFASITYYFILIVKRNLFFRISNYQNHHDESDLFLLYESILYFIGELWAAKAGRNHISKDTFPSFLLIFYSPFSPPSFLPFLLHFFLYRKSPEFNHLLNDKEQCISFLMSSCLPLKPVCQNLHLFSPKRSFCL